jgi:hypothetical protein
MRRRSCKIFIDRLPTDNKLEVVEIKADGNLANVRGKLAALQAQRRALLDVPRRRKRWPR